MRVTGQSGMNSTGACCVQPPDMNLPLRFSCWRQVSHDDKGVTSISFLEGVDVRRPGRVADLLARAMRQRAVGATATNEHSSRSHMVFSLNITGTNATSGQQVHGECS